jgi:hypothetical protein
MVGSTIGRANGAIIYQGASRIDGSPIVVIATGLKRPSQNDKTGAMIQTWILRADMHPVESVQSGADSAICGECPLRPLLARESPGAPMCYVNKGFGPASVYRAFLTGAYPEATPREVQQLAESRDLPIRFGAYGDPGAAPLELWRALDGKRHTGYSHQWRRFRGLRSLTMASADSLGDARAAWSRGWRTFRVVRDIGELEPNEILCPASAEAGKRTTCAQCGLCNGSSPGDRRKSIAIVDHGPTAARAA